MEIEQFKVQVMQKLYSMNAVKYRVINFTIMEYEYEFYYDGYIDVDDNINFINADDYFYFLSKKKLPLSIYDDTVTDFRVYAYDETYNRCSYICHSDINSRDDFSFSVLPIPHHLDSNNLPSNDPNLHLLIVRYEYMGLWIIGYQIAYKGLDPLNPDDWNMFFPHQNNWVSIISVYKKVNVLAWRSLNF